MNHKDLKQLAGIEERIMATESIYLIEQLENFPYSDIVEIRDAVANKSISLFSDYNIETLTTFSTGMDRKAHNIWLSVPILIVLFTITYAIYSSNNYLFIGIPLALIGFFLSSPHFKYRTGMYAISFGVFIFYIVVSNQTGYILSGSFLFSLWTTITAREICTTAIQNCSLESPILFTYMFRKKIILMFDNKADKFINPN